MALVNKEKNEIDESIEDSKKENKIRYRIRPTRYFNYDVSKKEFDIEFHLPGVSKNKIELKFLDNAYTLKARRNQAEYHSSEYFPFEIKPDEVEANYSNGLLSINGKIKDPMDDAVEIKLS